MSIDGLSLSFLVNELHDKLSGGRIERIFQPDTYTLLIWVRQAGKDFPLIISANPSCPKMHLTETIPENPATPPNFCMLVRKHLEDGRIAKVAQHSLDRIVIISVDTRGAGGIIATKELIIELMGKHSNIILTLDGKIIDAIKKVGLSTSSYRQVLPNRDYFYPPGQDRINILDTPATDFVGRITADSSGSAAKKTLAKEIISAAMGTGPFTVKEIAWRAGLSTDISSRNLDAADQNALSEAVESITEPLKAGQIHPTVTLEVNHTDTAGETFEIPIAVTAFELEHLRGKYILKRFTSMNQAVEFFYSQTRYGRPDLPSRDSLAKFTAGEITKLSRKKTAISQELADAENGGTFRKWGDILLANLNNVPVGSSRVILTDIYNDASSEFFDGRQDEQVVIELDPHLSAAANAQVYYSKYNKSKRILENLSRELKLCLEEIEYLKSIDLSLEQAQTSQEILDIRQELIAANYIKETAKGKKTQKHRPQMNQDYLTAQTSDGFTVLIGKNNRQNDLVTFKHSHPDDLWFHTKDIPGSHVILKTDKKKVSGLPLSEAAQIAAYFSKARQSANVPVDYTLRRFVKKPVGAKPGFVYYEKQTTLYVTPEERVIANLLKKTHIK